MEISNILAGAFGNADRSANKLTDDFDTFLTLLTAQLKAQDPLDPVDSTEFTNQLVQFTGVEQQIQQNKNLENLTALTAFYGMQASVGFIGKEITVAGSDQFFESDPVTWLYELQNPAFSTKVEIKDASGKTVTSLEGQTVPGTHAVNWDGRDASGNLVPRGYYTISVTSEDVNGNPVRVNNFIRGRVQGVELENGESLLAIAGKRVPVTDVVAVRDPEDSTTAQAAQ